jgi:hypothetical protein
MTGDQRINLAELRELSRLTFPQVVGEQLLALVEAVEAAQRVNRIYEGLRTDENDGTFALWSEDDLVAALHALDPVLRPFGEPSP